VELFIAVLPYVGLAKKCPIKTRETAGIYGAGLTIVLPGKAGTISESLHAEKSSPYGLKSAGGSEEDLVGWRRDLLSNIIHGFREKRYWQTENFQSYPGPLF